MKIQLKQLTLTNFKGIRNKTIDLNPDGDSFIFGSNATGKTTVFDAFTWLLFGKDSAGRSDFEIKTLDSDGQAIEKLDHEVTGLLLLDGKETEIKRVLREKWVKKRGAEVTEFEGNETLLSVNGVPKKANEFKDYINSIINESLFKLITSPTAFNSLKWEERRKILTDICGTVGNNEVISLMEIESDRKQWLLDMLASDKSMADHKKEIAAKVRALKDEIKTIPTRIDEVERSKPDLTNINTERVDVSIQEMNDALDGIDAQIANKSKAMDAEIQKVNDKKKVLVQIETAIEAREKQIKTEVDNQVLERDKLSLQLQNEINSLTDQATAKVNERKRKTDSVVSINEQIERINKQITDKRTEWSAVNAKEFTAPEVNLCCPTCKREFDPEHKEFTTKELQENFNTDKSNQLEAINSQGAALKSKLESLQAELKQVEIDSQKITEEIALLTEQMDLKGIELSESKECLSGQLPAGEILVVECAQDSELIRLKTESLAAEIEIENLTAALGTDNNEDLLAKKSELNAEIYKLKVIQSKIDEVAKADKRIDELKAKEKELAHTQAQIERDEFLLNKFTRYATEQIERKVNSMFEIVKFKMFEQQINGGESETCVCTVNGVSYPDLNNAMKIQAGLDIIKTLSSYYKLSAPIFIDNRESVVSIGKQEAQIINLVVSKDDAELRVV